MTVASNKRIHPRTGAISWRTMDPEIKTIAVLANLPGIHGFQLQDFPRNNGSLSVVENVTGGASFDHVTDSDPLAGQYFCNFDTGVIIFHSSDTGKEILVNYEGGGTVASMENLGVANLPTYVNLNDKTELSSSANDDILMIGDKSVSELKKIEVQNLNLPSYSNVNGKTELTTPADDDIVLIGDITASTLKKIQVQNLVPKANPESVAVITTQAEFEAAIERIGSNEYQFLNQYKEIHLKRIIETGDTISGYDISGIIETGDTHAKLNTNNVVHLHSDHGAFIDVSGDASYINVDTDDCLLERVHLKGDTTTAAITYSFLLAAHRVTFRDCKTSDRRTNGSAFRAFFGNATYNRTVKLIGCSVYNISESSTSLARAFEEIDNLTNCEAYNIDCSSASIIFMNCDNLVNCYAYDCDGITGEIRAFSECNRISSSYAENITSDGISYGFHTCTLIASSEAKSIVSTDNTCAGFFSSDQLSACRADTITGGSGGTDISYGFQACDQISGCIANNISSPENDAYGFHSCGNVSGCFADNISSSGSQSNDDAVGFRSCNRISACRAGTITVNAGTAHGFKLSNFISSSDADLSTNDDNNFVDTTDADVTTKVSTSTSKWTTTGGGG